MYRMPRLIHVLVPSMLLALLSACGAILPATPATRSDTVTTTAPTTVSTQAAATEEIPTGASETPAPVGATTLNVFAAASLTDAFGEISQTFEEQNPGVTIAYNFAGSNQLAQQITQGAPADIFASANKRQMDVVVEAGHVISDTQRTFVHNRLILIYPSGNPAGVQTMQDLARPGIKLIMASKEVPIGQYAIEFLARASLLPTFPESYSQRVLGNVVSYEENVRTILTKVSLGEADAGIVYSSDVSGKAARTVGHINIPDQLNTIAGYPIAATKNAPNAELAQRFISFILSSEAQAVLAKHGFIPAAGGAS